MQNYLQNQQGLMANNINNGYLNQSPQVTNPGAVPNASQQPQRPLSYDDMMKQAATEMMNALSKRSSGGLPEDLLKQISGIIKPYYDPYIEAGKRSIPTLEEQYKKLISDPSGFMASLGKGYSASPGYQYSVQQATDAANRAAAAGGMLGTPMEQQELAKTVGGLANQDYSNYLNNVMKSYGLGLGGYGELGGMGFKSANELAQSLANTLLTQANLAYQKQAESSRNKSGAFGGIGSLISGIGSLFF